MTPGRPRPSARGRSATKPELEHPDHCLLCNNKIHKACYGREKIVALYTKPSDNWTTVYLSPPGYSNRWASRLPGHPFLVPVWWGPNILGIHGQWTIVRKSMGRSLRQQRHLFVWVFPFHEHCWEYLSQASSRIGIQLDNRAIYEVAMSLQCEDEFRNLEFEKANRKGTAQVERPLTAIEPKFESFVPFRSSEYRLKFNTLDRGEVECILRSLKQGPLEQADFRPKPGRSFLSSSFRSGSIVQNDPFIRLPPEIMMMIFNSLPVSSVGKVRVASPACASVELGEKFFRQLFRLDGPYGFLHADPDFHNKFDKGAFGSYAGVYLVCRSLGTLGLTRHRRRIWDASLELLRLVATRKEAPICLGNEWFRPRKSKLPNFNFPQAKTIEILQGKKRLLYSRWIQTTGRLREIQVSTMMIKNRTYISGISFIQENEEVHCLGFMHPDNAQAVWSSSLMVGNRGNPSQVRLALDKMGIRAIRFWGRAYQSSWIGDFKPKGMSTRKVKLRYNMAKDGTNTRVFFVEARFDNLKLMDFV